MVEIFKNVLCDYPKVYSSEFNEKGWNVLFDLIDRYKAIDVEVILTEFDSDEYYKIIAKELNKQFDYMKFWWNADHIAFHYKDRDDLIYGIYDHNLICVDY
jgi:hypothetical protein